MATKTMRSERIFVTVTSVFDSTGYTILAATVIHKAPRPHPPETHVPI